MLKKVCDINIVNIILRARVCTRDYIYAQKISKRMEGENFLVNRSSGLTFENTKWPRARFGMNAVVMFMMAFLIFGLLNLKASPPAQKNSPEKKINVKKALKSRKREKRMEALDHVRRKKEIVPVPDLIEVKAHESDSQAKYRIIQAIGAQGTGDAVNALLNALKNDPDSNVRISAAQELGNYNQSAGVTNQLIQSLKIDMVEDVRIACARSLAFAKSDAAIFALIAAAEDQNPLIRRQAVTSLGRYRTPEAKRAIKKHQNDSDKSVRKAAGGKE